MENNIDYVFNEIAAKTMKKYREEKGLSLEEVVRKMKNPISRQSLFKYENNLARMKIGTFIDICNALNINPGEVYQEINQRLIFSSGKLSKELNQPIDVPFYTDSGEIEYAKVFGTEEMTEQYLEKNNEITFSDSYTQKNEPLDELDILFSQYRDKLSEKDKEYIKFILNQTKSEFENKKGDGN